MTTLPKPAGRAAISADLPSWTGRDTLFGTLATLLPLLTLNVVILAAGSSVAKKPLTTAQDTVGAFVQVIFATALEAAFLLAPRYYARRRAGRAGWEQLGFRGTGVWSTILLVFIGIMLTYLIGYLYEFLAQTLFHINPQTNLDELKQQIGIAPRSTVATVIVATFAAPIFEEVFFRGFLLQGLRRVLSNTWAIVLSAAIFAIAHLNPGSTILLFVLGVLLGGLRVWTGSIWPSILLHFVNNALGLIAIITLLMGS